ncbi:unnamed protein product [Cercospora beticola]|nr:unnamed protein product [Cercospora beticola]
MTCLNALAPTPALVCTMDVAQGGWCPAVKAYRYAVSPNLPHKNYFKISCLRLAAGFEFVRSGLWWRFLPIVVRCMRSIIIPRGRRRRFAGTFELWTAATH